MKIKLPPASNILAFTECAMYIVCTYIHNMYVLQTLHVLQDCVALYAHSWCTLTQWVGG